MAQSHMFEGTPDQLAQKVRMLPSSMTYRLVIVPEEAVAQDIALKAEQCAGFSLEAAISRLNDRSAAEIDAVRRQVLASAPQPLPLADGQTLADVIMGQWPGEESEEVIGEALRKLS